MTDAIPDNIIKMEQFSAERDAAFNEGVQAVVDLLFDPGDQFLIKQAMELKRYDMFLMEQAMKLKR